MFEAGKLDGIIGIGGNSNTAMATDVMKSLKKFNQKLAKLPWNHILTLIIDDAGLTVKAWYIFYLYEDQSGAKETRK